MNIVPDNFSDRKTWVDFAFDLYKVYGRRGKSYHGLAHIDECFGELNKALAAGLVENEEALRLAIWFHDYFQDHEGDDEEKSAKMGYEVAIALGHTELFAKTVHRLIMVTKHNEQYAPVTPDEMLMCDIDLVRLAADNFEAHSDAVQMEYPDVPPEAFAVGRKAALKPFLDRPHVFHTPFYRERLEASAKRNLAALCSDSNS